MAEMRTIYNSARQSADSLSRWACFLLSNNKRRNNYDIDYDLDDGDRIMVDDSFYDDVLDAFEEYDIEYEEV